MNGNQLDNLDIKVAASAEELAAVQSLRYEVYANEMKLDLPGADHRDKAMREELDESAIHLYAASGGKVVGAVRINLNRVPPGLEVQLEMHHIPRPFCYCSRLNVLKQQRGSGVVARLARASFAEFYRLHATIAICHCYPHLQKLYQRMGFRIYGKPFVQPGLDWMGWQRPMKCELDSQVLQQSA